MLRALIGMKYENWIKQCRLLGPGIRTCFEDGAKRLGGGVRGMALLEDAPLPLEVRLPVSLFVLPRRVELRLRTLDPIHSLGHGKVPEADPADSRALLVFGFGPGTICRGPQVRSTVGSLPNIFINISSTHAATPPVT